MLLSLYIKEIFIYFHIDYYKTNRKAFNHVLGQSRNRQQIKITEFTNKIAHHLLKNSLFESVNMDIELHSEENFITFVKFLADWSRPSDLNINISNISLFFEFEEYEKEVVEYFKFWHQQSTFLGVSCSDLNFFSQEIVQRNPDKEWYLPFFNFSDYTEELDIHSKDFFINKLEINSFEKDLEKLMNTKLKITHILVFHLDPFKISGLGQEEIWFRLVDIFTLPFSV